MLIQPSTILGILEICLLILLLTLAIIFNSHILSTNFSKFPAQYRGSPSVTLMIRSCATIFLKLDFRLTNLPSGMASGDSNPPKLGVAQRYASLIGKDVWNELTEMAQKNQALDLGQGFPNFFPPKTTIFNALAQAATDENVNSVEGQGFYPGGHPRLVEALAKLYSKLWEREFRAEEEILVTAGAYEALFCSISAFVNPGDQVIIVEPFFRCYEPMIRTAGGEPVVVTLIKPSTEGANLTQNWYIDVEELKRAFNPKTKVFLLNTPHNPTGKVFGYEELKLIAELCQKHDVLCISDEVYEWLTYEPHQHVRIASLPGMWNRTVTIGSAGKMFGVTGWRIGWAYGDSSLMANLRLSHETLVWCCPTPYQEALARVLESEQETNFQYLKFQLRDLAEKRNGIVHVLKQAGMTPVVPQGGYFVITNWTDNAERKRKVLAEMEEKGEAMDMTFVRWLSQKGIQAVPSTIFYLSKHRHLGESYVRFCFIKDEETLRKAGELFRDLL